MTAFARHPDAPPLPNPPAGVDSPPRLVTLRWTIGRNDRRAEAILECEIETRRERSAGIAFRLTGPEGAPIDRPELALQGGSARWLAESALSLLHLDAPGLSLTIDTQADRVLFARTAAFGALGVPGGRYELVGARIDGRAASTPFKGSLGGG